MFVKALLSNFDYDQVWCNWSNKSGHSDPKTDANFRRSFISRALLGPKIPAKTPKMKSYYANGSPDHFISNDKFCIISKIIDFIK